MSNNIPNIGDRHSESQLVAFAKSEGYTYERIGNPVNGGMLLLLSQSNMPIGMSFILVSAKESVFQRVY
jgi:hypothetical protein